MSSEIDHAATGRASAVVIDASFGTRHLDNTRSSPKSLKMVGPSRTVLDWILHALARSGITNVTYVGGYHIQKVIQKYPGLNYRFHAEWRGQGELAGLRLALPTDPVDWLVIRSDTICVPDAVRIMHAHRDGVGAGIYGDEPDQHFAGIVAVPATAALAAAKLADSIARRSSEAGLEEWLAAMPGTGLPVRRIALDSLAAPASDPVAVARTVFGGKGRTLEQVRPLIRTASVLDQVRFSAESCKRDSMAAVIKVERRFPGISVLVRSSSSSEDSLAASGAGRFATVLDVPVSDRSKLQAAIEKVVTSFARDGRAGHPGDEVLVQPYLDHLAASGVILTRDPETGGPYYVLNIDRQSGRSDTVTSGSAAEIETVYIAREAEVSGLDHGLQACVSLARELELLMHLDSLDVEFGIDRAGQLYLFQVRPIATLVRKYQLADDDVSSELGQIQSFLDAHMRPHPTLFGNTTVFGTMPDWNPAEMIGTAPRPLALSLYQRLIGNDAWAAARASIGYRDVRPEPLVVSLGGRPYVDVRASLNSFLPEGLDESAAGLWVDHCLQMLSEDGRLHDKIEFEVAITCLPFDFTRQAGRLKAAGLDSSQVDEFRSRLLSLTDSILKGNVAPVGFQRSQLHELSRRRERWLQQPASGTSAIAGRISALLADCERFGVVPFSVLARYAFIATSLLRSLRDVDVFSERDVETFLGSIPTIASELSRDLGEHAMGRLDTDSFMQKYGHLRPGSYDITSPNYASSPNILAFNARATVQQTAFPDVSVAREVFDRHSRDIEILLDRDGFATSTMALREFVIGAIPAREWAKFEFMKSVNAALENTAELGAELGLSRDDMSFLSVEQVIRGAIDSPNSASRMEFRRGIEFNRKRWNLSQAIRLPHLVREKGDVTTFRQETWTPNFVSTKRVVAPPVSLETGDRTTPLENRIVLIRAADPGFDWIFGHAIVGLITAYGGVASHMAIRAAEFGLPAAIGCGELEFNRLCAARLIDLDCTSKRVVPLS